MEPIFSTNYMGSSVKVYANRIEIKLLIQKITIPINSIASVDLVMPGYAGIKLETTGGKKYKIPVMLGQKKKLQEAINQAQCGQGKPVEIKESNKLDDLERLADLKEKGVISEKEFEAKKKTILDSL